MIEALCASTLTKLSYSKRYMTVERGTRRKRLSINKAPDVTERAAAHPAAMSCRTTTYLDDERNETFISASTLCYDGGGTSNEQSSSRKHSDGLCSPWQEDQGRKGKKSARKQATEA